MATQYVAPVLQFNQDSTIDTKLRVARINLILNKLLPKWLLIAITPNENYRKFYRKESEKAKLRKRSGVKK